MAFESLAQECAHLFCYYLKEIVLPDDNKGLFVGSLYLAGTQYAVDITESYTQLNIGESVLIEREKENPHDSKAVKVLTKEGKKLGYIPARHNLFLSQMLDFGISVQGEVRKLIWDESGVAIKVMLYAQS